MTRVLLSIFLLLISSNALALEIDDIRVGTHPDKNRLVIELDQKTEFRTFVLGTPDRLVIDLPLFNWNAGGIDNPANTGIKALRHGNLQPGISRIVLDLGSPIKIKSAFTLPAADNKPNRLVIDYVRANVTDKTVFGELNVEQPPPAKLSFAQPEIPTPAHKPSQSDPPLPTTAEKPLIIIDPGHGGVDPGAIGRNKVHEKRVVLKLSQELKKQLLNTGRYRVKMTRETDTFIRLSHRVNFARKHEGDLFISVHADSIGKPSVQGASVYTLSEKASDAQTARLAARENQADLIAGIDLSVEDDVVADILIDLAMRDTTNQSKFFANTLVDVLKQNGIKTLPNAHRYAGFAVLKAPDIPSVLVEAGFMSNAEEARKLNTHSHRKKIATALRKGIDAYFKQVRKNEKI